MAKKKEKALIKYIEKNFATESLARIGQANEIISEYEAQGFKLTLRQIYYQFVSRALIENTERSYKNLGSLISNARLAGLIDWRAIEDRTRFVRSLSHWRSPEQIIQAVAEQYRRDKWRGQETRVEVWIEKDALISIAEVVCDELDVAYFSCRGYVSQSELWEASNRLMSYASEDDAEDIVVIHLGDHDPSGIDMTRDIADRLRLFTGTDRISVERVALNMSQVEQYSPPPNPTKLSDSRSSGYVDEYGASSWELDALDPTTLVGVMRDAIESHLDRDLFDAQVERQEEERKQIFEVYESWDEVLTYLADEDGVVRRGGGERE